jgi:ribosomal protein S18 acetylase RimI-like enzyme
MNNVIVRKAISEDAQQIAEVHVLTWQCAYKGQIPDSYLKSLSIEKRTEGWSKQLKYSKKGIHTLVVEVDGKVVGWCTAGIGRDEDFDPEIGELYAIYIHPNFIGKGLGSKLMESALNQLRKDGYKKATLWVLNTNEKTRKWYENKGWKIEGKTKVDIRDNFELHETRYIIDL